MASEYHSRSQWEEYHRWQEDRRRKGAKQSETSKQNISVAVSLLAHCCTIFLWYLDLEMTEMTEIQISIKKIIRLTLYAIIVFSPLPKSTVWFASKWVKCCFLSNVNIKGNPDVPFSKRTLMLFWKRSIGSKATVAKGNPDVPFSKCTLCPDAPCCACCKWISSDLQIFSGLKRKWGATALSWLHPLRSTLFLWKANRPPFSVDLPLAAEFPLEKDSIETATALSQAGSTKNVKCNPSNLKSLIPLIPLMRKHAVAVGHQN